MPTYLETHMDKIHPREFMKPAPTFNTSLDMLPAFKDMVNDLMIAYHLDENTVLQRLLTFLATSISFEFIQAFFDGPFEA